MKRTDGITEITEANAGRVLRGTIKRRVIPLFLLFVPLFMLAATGGLYPGKTVQTPIRPISNAPAVLSAITGTPAPANFSAATPIARISDDAVNTISRGLYCPVCQNITLEVCPTEACSRWREQVRDLLAEGKTEPEIRAYFIDRFGMRTVGTPTDAVGQIIAVGVPFALLVLIGGALIVRVLQLQRNRPVVDLPNPETGYGDEATADIDYDDEYAARLERELKDRR